MNSNQIKCFLSVGKTLSFTQSAQDLYLSQSTISKNVSNLEKELGVKLLDRSHQRVKLTNKGARFYKSLIHINSEMVRAIQSLHTGNEKKPSVYLGYTDIPFEEEYLPLLIQMLNRRLNINLRMRIVDPNNSNNFEDLVRNQKLDYLIYQKDYFIGSKEVLFTPLLEQGFSVMVANGDPLYVRKYLNLQDLQGQNIWVWNSQESLPTINDLINRIKADDIDCNLQQISDSMVLIDYIQSGKGIGIVPSILYDKMNGGLRYIPLDVNIKILYGIGYLKSTQNKPFNKTLIQSFRQAINISKEKW